jgi:hypothetical protein
MADHLDHTHQPDPLPGEDPAGPPGYRGPGTDLGEDIRRGIVPLPGAEHAARRSSRSWSARLREGWHGLWRDRPGPGG